MLPNLKNTTITVSTMILRGTQLMIRKVSWAPISLLEWFLKDHVTLKIQLYHHRNTVHLIIYFKNAIIVNCNNITVFTIYKKINTAQ